MSYDNNQKALREYLKDAHAGKLLIPKFQRDFVWEKSKMIALVSSLLKGYPIGSFLLMENTGEYGGEVIEGANSEDKSNDLSGQKLILDGQQRTTTMYQVFYGKGSYKFYFNIKQYISDIKDVNAEELVNITEEKMEDWIIVRDMNQVPGNSPSAQIANGLFPLSILFNDDVISKAEWLSTFCKDSSIDSDGRIDSTKFTEYSKGISMFEKLIENVTGFQSSFIIINKDTSPNVVCSIFETLNSSGEPLTIIDLLNAKCFAAGFYLRDELETAFSKYVIFNSYKDKNDTLAQIIVKTIGLLSDSVACSRTVLLRLQAREIIEKWEIACQYVDCALRYMKENFGVIGINFIPYKDMVPALAVILNSEKFKKDAKSKEKVENWYWKSIFQGLFDNGSNSKNVVAIKEFLGTKETSGWFDDDARIPESVNWTATRESIASELESIHTTTNAKYRAIHNLILLNNSRDLISNGELVADIPISLIQDHHIFPKKYLARHGIKGNSVNTILNKTLISSNANEKINDYSPFQYLIKDSSIVGKTFSQGDVEGHCIDLSTITDEFSLEKYIRFKERRKEKITDLIMIKIG